MRGDCYSAAQVAIAARDSTNARGWLNRAVQNPTLDNGTLKTSAAAPVSCDKRDRRGWVTLRPRQLSLGLGL